MQQITPELKLESSYQLSEGLTGAGDLLMKCFTHIAIVRRPRFLQCGFLGRPAHVFV